MKYTYIHSPYDKNLICVETKEIISVSLPSLIPINTYGERVKESEREAIKYYENWRINHPWY